MEEGLSWRGDLPRLSFLGAGANRPGLAAHADSTAPDVILGAAGLSGGAAVWYGTYNGSPVQWRVLGGGNDGGNDSSLLLSEYIAE